MIVQGCHASEIANIIIEYFRKRYPSLKNPKYGVRIRKDYILSVEVDRVKNIFGYNHYTILLLKQREAKITKKQRKKSGKKSSKLGLKDQAVRKKIQF